MSNIETGGGNWYMPLDSGPCKGYSSLQRSSKESRVAKASSEIDEKLSLVQDLDTQDTQSVTSTSLSLAESSKLRKEPQRGLDSKASSSDFTYSFESKLNSSLGNGHDDSGGQVSLQKGRRKPGRPPSLFVDKSDSELTEEERKVKAKIIKRRLRQNRSYQRRKLRRQFEGGMNSPLGTAGVANYATAILSPPLYPVSSTQISEPRLNTLGKSAVFESQLSFNEKKLEEPRISGNIPSANELVANFDGPSYTIFPCSEKEKNHNQLRNREITNALTMQQFPSTSGEHSSHLPSTEPFLCRDLAGLYLDKLFKSLTPILRRTLFKLSVFPETFDVAAGKAVIHDTCIEKGSEESLLNTLNERGFIVKVSPKRLQLDLLSKQFLLREIGAHDDFNDWEVIRVAKRNFVSYYTNLLKLIDDERMILDGANMEQALRICDLERMNFEMCLSFAQELGSQLLRHTLIAGSNVLRLFIPASDRISLISSVLDLSRYEQSLSSTSRKVSSTGDCNEADIFSGDSSLLENQQEDALLLISLGEAYSDDLHFREAEQALCQSLQLLEQSGMDNKPCVLIPLIVLANIFRETDRTDHAISVLRRALEKLAEFHLENSSYGISVYENMALTLLVRNEREEARHFISNVTTLAESIRFEGLPLYTDILGTCGIFSLVFKDVEAAEGYFRRALENYGSFISRPWSRAPIESCRDLDLWILDNLSKALMLLDKTSGASLIQEQIEMISRIRGVRVCSVDSFESNDEEFGAFSSSDVKVQSASCCTSNETPRQYSSSFIGCIPTSKSDSELKTPSNTELECVFLDDATMILYHRVFIRHVY
ncbi:hypothetical protein GpartN1_g1221.t1 [Galdieria partita]|uniref:MalT-like TPR region domain-containing protein n=1 Tax=Galdieria partita TaxID=83374 RepID=A0A9C7UNE7_9RHOD|nr:hypothetical protein GpartN1_g1221.t1 [Galdieria partita]